MTRSVGHMTRLVNHMTKLVGHMTRLVNHMTRSVGHMTRLVDHMTRLVDHMTVATLTSCRSSLNSSYTKTWVISVRQQKKMEQTRNEDPSFIQLVTITYLATARKETFRHPQKKTDRMWTPLQRKMAV